MNIEIIVNLVCYLTALAFPFALVFWIVQKIVNFFVSLILGKEVIL